MDVRRLERVADWSSLASTLAGRPVDVRFEEPTAANGRRLAGISWKMRGKSIIQIDPERVGDDDFLRVFLHEAAHSRIHFPSMYDWQSEAHKMQNELRLQAMPPSVKYLRHEDEADLLTERWLGWCKSTDHLFIKVLTLSIGATVAKFFD